MRQPALPSFRNDRLRQRMLGFAFDASGQLQQVERRPIDVPAKSHNAAIDDNISDTRLALGERAGLVQRDDLHRGRAFKVDTALEENTAPCRAADCGKNGCRRADDQRAR
jgi:hypothetical protein